MRSSASAMCLAIALGASAPARATPAMTATSTAGATGLGLDGEGRASTHIVKVADVSLSTRGMNGLTVSITSGSLTRSGRRSVSFQVMLVSHNAAAPSSSAFTTASGTLYTFSTGAPATVDKDLYIKYRPASLQGPGGYAASIDIDVVDN